MIFHIFRTTSLTLRQMLWLRLFNHPDICDFSKMFDTAEESAPSIKLHFNLKQDFYCQFPFFWVVKELIETQWQSSKSIMGN